jgi:hypothetical protein
VKLDSWSFEYEQLDEDQPAAAGFFRRLMARAESSGIGDEDYKAPIGHRLKFRLYKPWIAEFRTKNSSETEDVRMYWGEAPPDAKSLAACLIGSKPANTTANRSLPRQDAHIGKAMDRLDSWCRNNDATCRKQQ